MCSAATLNNLTTFEVCRTPALLEQHQTEIVDSGCTGHFLLVTASCLKKVVSRNPLTVRLPNGATMESSHTADLNIPKLNAAASKAHVFPGMAIHSLLSVGQLCCKGYIVIFQQDTVTICNSGSSMLNYSHSRTPPVHAHMDAWMNPSAQRATQLGSVLVRVYAISIQNQITTNVPKL
jgi:hypothetical protein